MKRNKPKMGVTISPDNMKKLEKGQYNKSKLIDSLLDSYFKKLDKKKNK
jgi:hypothetical protein